VDAVVGQVVVEPAGDGMLEVAWELLGPDVDVDVAVGPTPASVDHRHALTVPAGTRSVRLPATGPGRRYVSVSPHGTGSAVVAAERRVPFEGVTNVRDLGGYPAGDGGRVRWGAVFRADALHKLTPADRTAFEGLGIRTVFDLRGEVEREEHPNPVESVHRPIVGRPPEPEGQAPDRSSLAAAADGEGLLRDIYVGALTHSPARIGEILTDLADAGQLPAVFHCHGGKDRTGIVAALLLLALGVDREAVLDDYEATARYRTIVHQQDSLANMLASGMAAEAAAGVLGAPRWAMAEALDALDADHGGIEAFLCGPAGMDPATLARLRATLVTGGG
jgi:protein-tyrosine phosphatase